MVAAVSGCICWWLAIASAWMLVVAQEEIRTIQSGQEFIQAMDAFGARDDVNMTIILPSGITSLQGLPYTPASQLATPGHTPYSSGRLTIRAADNSTSSILDGDSRPSVTGPMSGSAKLYLKGFSVVNLCEATIMLGAIPGTPYVTALGLALFSRSTVRMSHTYDHLTIYGRQADLGVYGYVRIMQASPFPELVQLTLPVTASLPPTQAKILLRTQYAVIAAGFMIPSAEGINVTFKSISNGGDPVLRALRASGRLLPPRFCNGTLLPESWVLAQVDPIAPLWYTTDTIAWVTALSEATDLAAAPATGTTYRGPPAILLSGSVLLGAIPQLPSIKPLQGALLLAGPPGSQSQGLDDLMQIFTQLDFGHCTGVLRLQPGAKLYIQYMLLSGFGTHALPTAPGAPSTSAASVFPLSAITPSLNDTTDYHIGMANVTLLLPSNDFLALLTLTLQNTDYSITNCIGSNITAHADALATGITALVPAEISPDDMIPDPCISLVHFAGWGINATNLWLRPDGPSMYSTLLRSCPGFMNASPSKAASSPSDATSGASPGVIVGCVLGGLALGGLLGGLAVCVWWAMRSRTLKGVASPDEQAPLKMFLEGSSYGTGVKHESDNQARSSPPVFSSVPDEGPQDTTHLAIQVLPAHHHGASLAEMVVEAERQLNLNLRQAGDGPPHTWDATLRELPEGASPQHSTHSTTLTLPPSQQQQQEASDVRDPPTSALVSQQTLYQLAPAAPHGLPPVAPSSRLSHLSSQRQRQNSNTGTLMATQGQAMSASNLLATQRQHSSTGQHTSNGQYTTPSSLMATLGDQNSSGTLMAGRTQHRLSSEWLDSRPQVEVQNEMETLQASLSSSPRAAADAARIGAGQTFTLPQQQVQQLADEIRSGSDNKVVVYGIVGRGACGLVFRGEWRGLPVALKTMVFSDGSQDRSGAILEAALAASLGHRNVVCTYHWDIQRLTDCLQDGHTGGLQVHMAFEGSSPATGSSPGTPAQQQGMQHTQYKLFLVQELCSLSLSQALSQGLLHDPVTGHAQTDLVYGLLCDIACGLAYMHERHIVHGDLKPGNVLLKADMAPASKMQVVAKLADFGLSSRITAEATHLSGFSSGTPYYVAPEVIHEFRTSTASDMWSYGVLMWQMYSGRTPYLVDTAGAYIANPLFPSFDPTLLPGKRYEDLLTKCLLRNPHERPTAVQALGILTELSTQQPAASAGL